MNTLPVPTSLRSRILTALVGLGPTPRVVASSLVDLGVRGHTSNYSCPISNFIRGRVLRDIVTVDTYLVSTGMGYIHLCDPIDGEVLYTLDTPPIVSKFVKQFDLCLHPDLIGKMRGLESLYVPGDEDYA